MIRITITHVRDHPNGSTTETIEDEYLGLIEDLADRLRKCRAALEDDQVEPDASPELERRLAELAPVNPPKTVDTVDRLDAEKPRLKPPTVIAPPNHAPVIVSTAPRPVTEWTGSKLFSWAKHKPGALEFVQSFGATHGFPRRILEWSRGMCDQAHAAWQAEHERSVA